MKEKDFEDIGKRLRDLDAEPPENGWNKIFASLKVEPPANISWFKKHWTKFFLLLFLPAGIYLLAPDHPSNNTSSGEKEFAMTAPSEETDKSLPDVSNAIAIDRTGNDYSKHKQQELTPYTKQEPEKNSRQSSENDLTVGQSEITKSLISNSNGIAIRNDEQITDLSTNDNDNDAQKRPAAYSSETTVLENNVNSSEQAIEPPASRDRMDEANYGDKPAPSAVPETETFSQDKQTSANTDSISDLSDVLLSNEINANTSEEQNSLSKWRLTISFLPQYGNKTALPDTDDDVLVTGLKRKDDPLKIDFGFAVGVGIALKENLYLDAQVTYTQIRQNTFLSYATGKVDTLLAVQQSDQSVRIVPVYQTDSREFSNKYSYIGLRFGATQYFWTNSKRRFNISAMMGTNYLASSTVKEKVTSNWTSINTRNLNKINYTATLGVGYNIYLQKGWELMINPSITYYLRSVKTAELPYNFRQQSYGLNLMLSKEIGKN